MNSNRISQRRERARLARGIANVTFAAVVGFAGLAHAGDFCMNLGTTLYVGKAFTLPSKNRCKPFYGTALNLSVTPAVTGSACTSSEGERVDFALTEVLLGGAAVREVSPIHHLVRISLIFPKGVGDDFFKVEGAPASSRPAQIVSCPTPIVSIP